MGFPLNFPYLYFIANTMRKNHNTFIFMFQIRYDLEINLTMSDQKKLHHDDYSLPVNKASQ